MAPSHLLIKVDVWLLPMLDHEVIEPLRDLLVELRLVYLSALLIGPFRQTEGTRKYVTSTVQRVISSATKQNDGHLHATHGTILTLTEASRIQLALIRKQNRTIGLI
jgi:hypothetical protein